jgi:hypothetical protein
MADPVDPTVLLPAINAELISIEELSKNISSLLKDILEGEDSIKAERVITQIVQILQLAHTRAKSTTEVWKQINSIKSQLDIDTSLLHEEREAANTAESKWKRKLKELDSKVKKCDELQAIWEGDVKKVPAKACYPLVQEPVLTFS